MLKPASKKRRRGLRASGGPASPASVPTPLPSLSLRHAWVPAAFFLLALAVRFWGIGWGLPAVYEEAYPLKVAWRMTGWETGEPFRWNPEFFFYPSLVIYLQLAVLGVVRAAGAIGGWAPDLEALRTLWETDPTIFYCYARGVTAVLGASIVLPVHALAGRASGGGAAWLAAGLVALNPFLISKSQMVDVDTPTALLTTLAILGAVLLAAAPRERLYARAAWCGAIAGLAASAKYVGALAIVPVLLAIVMGTGRWGVRAAASAAIVAMGAAAAAFLVTSPYVALDPGSAWLDLREEAIHQQSGHFGSETGATWAYYARAWFADALGWTVGALAAIGTVAFAIVRRERWAILAGIFLAAVLLVLGSSSMKADRYLLPAVPVAVLFASVAAARAIQRMPSRALAWGMAAALAAAAAVSMVPGWGTLLARRAPDSRAAAEGWIERHLAEGALIVTEAYGPNLHSPLTGLNDPDRRQQFRGTSESARKRFWVLQVPMYQVAPERSEPYYDPALWEHADAWIVTGAVASRYREDRARFAAQNAFYDWLQSRWREAGRFRSPAGSEIVVYTNPGHALPFGKRVVPPPPPTPKMTRNQGMGGEAGFYFGLAMNYYAYGYLKESSEAIGYALTFPAVGGGVTRERLIAARELLEREAAAEGANRR